MVLRFEKVGVLLSGVVMFAACTSVFGQQITTTSGDLTELIIPDFQSAASRLNFSGARAFPLPVIDRLPSGPPGRELREEGKGSDIFESKEHGDLSGANPWEKPYNTKRVATKSIGTPATQQPYSAAGKLYFNIDGATYVCSGAMIKTGLVATAAHCVAGFGQGTFYTDFVFVPAKHFGAEPYGQWTASSVVLKSVYLDGTDDCAAFAPGIICRNDVAVIRLSPKTDSSGDTTYPGDWDQAGRFGFSVNNNGFNSFKEAAITQLGYPVSHDSGLAMHETTSQSTQVPEFVDNNVIGSRQTGGTSGGPWVINHAYRGQISVPTGNAAGRNLISGVSSWGYTSSSIKLLGASKFTDGNMTSLLNYYGCGTGSTARHCVD